MSHIVKSAEIIKNCEVLIILAGAGIGVDSGFFTFRGKHRIKVPALEHIGITYNEASTPIWFAKDAAFAWGLINYKLEAFQNTQPHQGFYLLQDWIAKYNLTHYVVTTNVDEHFQKAGFAENKICELHGSLFKCQCIFPCNDHIWKIEGITVNPQTLRAKQFPRCPVCQHVARPNVSMFDDWAFISEKSNREALEFRNFVAEQQGKSMVVLEIGVGTVAPRLRGQSEELANRYHAKIIRINPEDPHIASPHIFFDCGALAALTAINEHL